MKKEYVKPEIQKFNIEAENLLAGSNGYEVGGSGSDNKDEGSIGTSDGGASLAPHRSVWDD